MKKAYFNGVLVYFFKYTIWFLVVFGIAKGAYAQSEPSTEFKSGVSLSIFLDNYDIWSNELIKKNSLNAIESVEPLSRELSELRDSGRSVARETDEALLRIANSKTPTLASLNAAIVLSQRKSGSARIDALRRARAIAVSIRPLSEEAIVTLVMLAQTYLEQQDLVSAGQLRPEVRAAVERSGSRYGEVICTAQAVLADISFSLGDFEDADDNYERTSTCMAAVRSSGKHDFSRLPLRRAWTSYRLMKYDSALRFLEAATPKLASESPEIRRVLASDLSKMLGVSLSETAPSVPAFHWVRNSQEFDWVGQGLVNSIRYLAQAGRMELALRWSQYLEPYLKTSMNAPEFFQAGLEVLEKSGRLEQLNEHRMRAVVALRSDGAFARSLSAASPLNRFRSELVISLSKEVFDYFSGLRPDSVGNRVQLLFSEVTESFFGESFIVCDESRAVAQAHRFLALSLFTQIADRAKKLIEQCQLKPAEREEIVSENLEMHRKVWKNSGGSDAAWAAYKLKLDEALSAHISYFSVRLIALEAASDALLVARLGDAEVLADALFSTNNFMQSSENRQFETEALVSLLVNLLSHNSHSASVARLAWDVHGYLLSSLGRLNRSVLELEYAIGAAVVSKSLTLRQSGQIQEAVESIASAASKFGSSSSVGRDFEFMTARLSCSTGLQKHCLNSVDSVIGNSNSSKADQYYAFRWKGQSLWQRGSFIKAADTLLLGSSLAIDAGLVEKSKLILDDLKLAGRIFTDLMLWEKSIKVRDLIVKMTKTFGVSARFRPEILVWTGRAIRSGAFEVAAELSSGLSEGSATAKSGADSALFYTRLISSYARFRANLESGDDLDKAIEGFARAKTKNQNLVVANAMDDELVADIVSEVTEYRRRQVLNRYRDHLSGISADNLNVRLAQLSSDFKKIKIFCKNLYDQSSRSVSGEQRCSSEFARTLLRYSGALRRVHGRSFNSEVTKVDSSFVVRLDSLESQLRTLLSSDRGAFVDRFVAPANVFEYRNSSGMALLGKELSR